jgi:predicted  nucleic acid-binding Zn-ribbon protein
MHRAVIWSPLWFWIAVTSPALRCCSRKCRTTENPNAMDVDARVFFQIHGLDTVYKLKLSPRSSFRHLFSHVPISRGGDPVRARFIWFDTVLQPDLTPSDYAMAPGEHNAHVVRVEFGTQAADVRSASTRSDDSLASSATGAHARGLAYFSRSPRQTVHSFSRLGPVAVPPVEYQVPAAGRPVADADVGSVVDFAPRLAAPTYTQSDSSRAVTPSETHFAPRTSRFTAGGDASVARARTVDVTSNEKTAPRRRAALASPARVNNDDDEDRNDASHQLRSLGKHLSRSPAASRRDAWSSVQTDNDDQQRPVAGVQRSRDDIPDRAEPADLESTVAGSTLVPVSRSPVQQELVESDREEVKRRAAERTAIEREAAHNAKITELSAQLLESRRALASQQHHAASHRNDETALLKSQLEHTKKVNDKLRGEVRNLELAQLETRQQAATESESRHTKEISDLRSSLRSIDDGRAKLDSLTRAHESLKSEYATLKAFAEEQSADLQRVTRELTDVRKEYDEAMEEMRSAIEALQAENEGLVSQSSVSSQNAIMAQREMKELRDRLEKEAKTAARVPLLTARVDDLEKQLAAAEAELRVKFENDLQKWQHTATDLNATVQSLRNEVATSNDAAARAQREADALRRRLADLEPELDAAQRDLIASQRESAVELHRLGSVKNELEASLVECNSVIIASQREAGRLRRQLLEAQQAQIEAVMAAADLQATSAPASPHLAASFSEIPRVQSAYIPLAGSTASHHPHHNAASAPAATGQQSSTPRYPALQQRVSAAPSSVMPTSNADAGVSHAMGPSAAASRSSSAATGLSQPDPGREHHHRPVQSSGRGDGTPNTATALPAPTAATRPPRARTPGTPSQGTTPNPSGTF